MLEKTKAFLDETASFIQQLTWRKFFIMLIVGYLFIQFIVMFPKMLLISVLIIVLYKLIINEKKRGGW